MIDIEERREMFKKHMAETSPIQSLWDAFNAGWDAGKDYAYKHSPVDKD